MNKQEAQDIFDGAMLSDANLSRQRGPLANSQFHIEQTDHSHVDWLLSIKDALQEIGVGVSPMYPKIRYRLSHGKPVSATTLPSNISPILTALRRKWYPNGIKVVPTDIALSPMLLANWYMGDGSSTYVTDRTIKVIFATNSFTNEDVDRLILRMHSLGIIDAYRDYHLNPLNQKSPIIHIGILRSVQVFMDIVEPCMCESFKYKIKRPKYG